MSTFEIIMVIVVPAIGIIGFIVTLLALGTISDDIDQLRDCRCICKKMGDTETGDDKAIEHLSAALVKNAEVLSSLANRSMNAALIEGRQQLQRVMREEETNAAMGDDGAPEHPMGLSPGFSAPPRDGTLGGRPNMMP